MGNSGGIDFGFAAALARVAALVLFHGVVVEDVAEVLGSTN